NRGVALDDLGRYEEALKAIDKAIVLKPDYAEAWNNRGVALDDLGRYEEALKAFDKAIELKPDDASPWYNKACAYSLKGDKENALKHLSKVIALDAKSKEEAKSDADFKNLWDDEDFKRIVS
ncbi:Photosystem I assembly protein Ycf3, partial [ANME-1 cluster archaeon GoMg3.2]|nr:Photosystem I assembly protein Ycf3 [ANME-1 cluster archaeon GoMg3.2]